MWEGGGGGEPSIGSTAPSSRFLQLLSLFPKGQSISYILSPLHLAHICPPLTLCPHFPLCFCPVLSSFQASLSYLSFCPHLPYLAH